MFTRRTLLGAVAAVSLLAGATGAGAADKLYVPLISKGFQHQFWQAVKAGADKAGKELGVEVTFEGPDNESQVDKQIDMLAAALAKKPAAIGFAALDSQAAIPLLKQAQEAKIPSSPSTPASTAISRSPPPRPTISPPQPLPPTRWPH